MHKLVCTHPFFDRATGKPVNKGQHITDPAEVARHSIDREKHFVRVAMTADEIAEIEAEKKAAPAF